MIIGYARAATESQNIEQQKEALRRANCVEIFSEIGSGLKNDRPELSGLLTNIQAGDTVIAYDRSRISRNTTDFLRFENEIKKKGASLRFIKG